jgi:hypothetical protein
MHEFEAEMIVAALNEIGIHATSTGEFVSNFKAEAPGNVQVLVRQSDLEQASKILADFRNSRSEVSDGPESNQSGG